VAQKFVHVSPHTWLTLEARVKKIFEGRRDTLGVLRGLVRRGNLVEKLEDLVFLLAPWRLLCYHFEDSAAETPNVGKPVVACLLDHLGRHPERRTAEAFCFVFVSLYDFLRASEVS
jgi:hypothetical protein